MSLPPVGCCKKAQFCEIVLHFSQHRKKFMQVILFVRRPFCVSSKRRKECPERVGQVTLVIPYRPKVLAQIRSNFF